MGSSRKPKSVRANSTRPGQGAPTDENPREATSQSPAKAPEIPDGLYDEIENQRDVLVTIITLLHCLHVVLEHWVENVDEQVDPRIEIAIRWSSLPHITALLLERTRSVLNGLDSFNLTNAMREFKP
jgi:hypothetical protein